MVNDFGPINIDEALIAPQVAQQIRVADLTLLTKTGSLDSNLSAELGRLGFKDPMLPTRLHRCCLVLHYCLARRLPRLIRGTPIGIAAICP